MAELDEQLADGTLKYKVPRTTMNRWVKDDWVTMAEKGQRGLKGFPHWQVEAEVRNRTELTRAGVGSVLGAAETRLMVVFGEAAKKGSPYLEEEIDAIVKTTLITLELKNPMTRQPYTEMSDISVLIAGFLDRCKEKGVVLNWKGGRKLGLQRWMRSNWETLDRYGKQVCMCGFEHAHIPDCHITATRGAASRCAHRTPHYLLMHTTTHSPRRAHVPGGLAGPARASEATWRVKLTLVDVGNFDEAQVDLCEFAEKGTFLVLQWFGNNVVVLFEQSPHLTLKWGFIGTQLFVCMLIKIGNGDASAPHPHHCQLLESSRYIVLAQSVNGWTNTTLTSALLKLQYSTTTRTCRWGLIDTAQQLMRSW